MTTCGEETPSRGELAEGFGLTRAAMAWYEEAYLGPDGDSADARASPLRARDLSGAAPAFLLTAEFDPLRDEGEAYARRLRDAGVPVTARRWEGVHHGFARLTAALPQAGAALDECAATLRAAFAGDAAGA